MGDLIVFGDKEVRRIWDEELKEWFFSVVDVVGVLSGSSNARDYWYRLKTRELENGGIQLSTICRQLKMVSGDGKKYMTDCADIKGIFRIIQSIPSKRAEPFKRWLAEVGKERVDEIENPELAQERMNMLYEKKGYSKNWIDKRLRGIAVRQGLTDEWRDRGIEEGREYAILTDEIARATFGVSIREHKDLKKLDDENLRDYMTDLELIFGMLGERVATEITISRDAKGFGECELAAIEGGGVAGNARREAEEKIGRSVVSKGKGGELPELREENKKEFVGLFEEGLDED